MTLVIFSQVHVQVYALVDMVRGKLIAISVFLMRLFLMAHAAVVCNHGLDYNAQSTQGLEILFVIHVRVLQQEIVLSV